MILNRYPLWPSSLFWFRPLDKLGNRYRLRRGRRLLIRYGGRRVVVANENRVLQENVRVPDFVSGRRVGLVRVDKQRGDGRPTGH